ncbi:MAG: STAS domain-containing protein [bacterium]
MKVEVEKAGDVAVLHLAGELNYSSTDDFYAISNKLVGDGCVKIVLDMSKVKQVDSMGFGALVGLVRDVSSRGGSVFLLNVDDSIRELFEITKLSKVFKFFSDLKQAVESFG